LPVQTWFKRCGTCGSILYIVTRDNADIDQLHINCTNCTISELRSKLSY
jgi:hypothetical protein